MPSILDLPTYESLRLPWQTRCRRYARHRAYYTGIAYEYLARYAATEKLYSGTRTLFSPLRRCVRVDAAKVPGAWSLPDSASTYTKNEVARLREATNAVAEYDRFVLLGGVAGDAALMLAGDHERPEPLALRADEVIRAVVDGAETAIVLKNAGSILGAEEYAQVITADQVIEYRDGRKVAAHANAFGFVPVALASYIEGEDGCGEPAFGGVLGLLDRVNELASLTLDVVTRNAEPLLVATGVQDIQIEPGQDAIKERNENAKFYTVNPQLAIADTLALIQDVRNEYKSQLPQLHLDELRSRSDLAYDTVMTMLSELGDHILAVRSSVDRTVAQVERWMLDITGGVPSDYAIDRDRRWMALSEAQALDLESKRLAIAALRRAQDEAQRRAAGSSGAADTRQARGKEANHV